MTIALGVGSIVLGLVYCQYGTMTLYEMVRSRRTMGFSHFGAAWVAMAFTCGPHHVHHGVHALAGHGATTLDLLVVLIGYPSGVGWFLLRVEAFRGGRGDRFVSGTPWWLLALPTFAGIYATALVAVALDGPAPVWPQLANALPNFLLVAIYAVIGYYLWNTQIANRPILGGWSVSGLCLAVIFPTCSVMHGVFAFNTLTGRYALEQHGLAIDVLAVPAGLYFLWVVHLLNRGHFVDWNRVPRPAVA